jgi:CO/xanthine dehydrogenase FAD-binding subunit
MNSFGVFFKNAPREVVDFAMVNVAMQITFQEGNGACKDAKIAVGGVTSFPVRSVKGEEVLKGEKITEKLMDEVAEVVVNDSTPISPIWVSPNLRRETIKALIKRGLQAAQAFSREL